MSRYYIGADIGGTFIKAAVVDGQGRLLPAAVPLRL